VEVKISVRSDQLDKEDVRALLQAIRDCERATFPNKEIFISCEVPEMTEDDTTDILNSIRPPYRYGPLVLRKP